MKRILVVGEDALCCALGERLVAACLPDWKLARASIDTGGVTNLKADLSRYSQQAQHVQPVLCVADTDGQCAAKLRKKWLTRTASNRLLLRLAVTEAESWLLADREGFSQALNVALSKLPHRPDEESDPKRLIVTLAHKSKSRLIREEVVSGADRSKPGIGYNQHLCAFAQKQWDVQRAARASPSLARAVGRLKTLGKVCKTG